MSKTVYLVNPKTRPVGELLLSQGYEVLVGDGSLNPELLGKCWAMIPGREPVTGTVLDMAPSLKLICKKGVGLNRIDIAACTERGICVANTPLSNYISVAEHTFALLLAAAKQLYPISLAIRCDEPDAKCQYRFPPTEIYGKTLSLIGLGNIGLRVAKLAECFDMHVVAYVRHPERHKYPAYIKLADSIDDAVACGDFVSLHVTGSKENRGLIGDRELGLMKPGAVLINMTRGFVVDERALYDALVSKRIAGAALDVFENEPITGDNPFLRLENVVATPHCAGYTTEANLRGYQQCAELIVDYGRGNYPATAVN